MNSTDCRRNRFEPWYGTENMETDEPIITHCGKTVEPIRVPGGNAAVAEMMRARVMKDAATAARTMSDQMNRRKMFTEAMQEIQSDWTDYEI